MRKVAYIILKIYSKNHKYPLHSLLFSVLNVVVQLLKSIWESITLKSVVLKRSHPNFAIKIELSVIIVHTIKWLLNTFLFS